MPKSNNIATDQQFHASEGLVWEVYMLSELSTSIPRVIIVGVSNWYTTKIIVKSVRLGRSHIESLLSTALHRRFWAR